MSGVLYIVATPIGNLDDMTYRAVKILQQVNVIAAEDTRHSQRLLNHLGIRKKMISLHQHNESQRVDQLLQKLEAGEDIALISDAGTPLISDPGYPLVTAVRDAGLRVSPIPGASSIIAALSAAGMPTDSFTFSGFLSQKNVERLEKLKALSQIEGTLVLLESSHRIYRLMEQLAEVMPDKRIVVAKELTKTHENFLNGQAQDILNLFDTDPALTKGEFVVLIDNPRDKEKTGLTDADIAMLELLLAELSLKKAVKLCSQLSGRKKNDLYQVALALTSKS
ncbi:MAG: 16S rRNA (cytidine(1402)-2'-O)-methyltransferase [Gammaproteobacteria bacterium]|nr:16S rRNA (cytidine(1402)-2'-O)-methyltransferase [Gammaproteobacteria bacterium]